MNGGLAVLNLNLNGKRVLVTGSSKGIGFAIARGFAQEGARVCLSGRSKESLTAARLQLMKHLPKDFGQDGAIIGEACDFVNENDVARLRKEIDDRWKGLDILVCNIGDGASPPSTAPSSDEVHRMLDINLFSCLNAIHAFLDTLSGNSGNILLISSIAGLEAIGAPGAYAAAKAAANSFVKTLAKKFPETAVRVNSLAPGNVLFDGGTWAKKLAKDHDGVMNAIHSRVPMQRFATTEEIANVAVFLASSAASFVNGATVVVDGGQTSKIN